MIKETIITTKNSDGTTHFAPMGIHMDHEHYVIAPFKPSRTLENLERNKHAVINMTDDVLVFAGCITGRREWPIKAASKVDGSILENTLAHIEVEVSRFEEDELRPRFYCREVYRENHRAFEGLNRAQGAVLEAAILTSRLGMISDEKIDSEIEYLRIAVKKTAGENEKIAWDWLMKYIDEFRNENLNREVKV